MAYGVLQCADSFLYIHTFLPIRFITAFFALIYRSISRCLGLRRANLKTLTPAEMCDLLKGFIWIFCTAMMLLIDTNRLYHIIKSQSVIKLYIFYNMLEVGDRLLSAFGQDTMDALFWTATEPKDSRKEHLGLLSHIGFSIFYVMMHSILIMFQATALNVAINSNSQGLLAIMLSNNFVELKGSVFKKFDKNNLFQLSCSDVRERFHLGVLLFIVVIQTMKEFNWKSEQLYSMLPGCVWVLAVEVIIDCLKHAFIIRFNELPQDVYKEYTLSLAYDMTQTRQKHAFSDHSDLVARRMGFIPFPLGVVVFKALYHALSFTNSAAIILCIVGYIVLITCRVLNTICALGKACDLMQQHQDEKKIPTTPQQNNKFRATSTTTDTATSPVHSFPLQRSQSQTVDNLIDSKMTSTPNSSIIDDLACLGATALFSNSDVDLNDVCLNDKVLNHNESVFEDDNNMTRSVPNLQKDNKENDDSTDTPLHHRTHKRSESEPSIQNVLDTINQ